jgi:CheY-like chemotaxis protein
VGNSPVITLPSTPAPTSSPTILLVEDDINTREGLGEYLEHQGYSVLSAENGKRALECLEATASVPVLILLDLVMPVMDGFAFISQISNHPKLASVPVIILTADLRGSQLRREPPENVKEVLSKPVNLRRMMELIRKYAQIQEPVTRGHTDQRQANRRSAANPSNLR